MEELLRREVSRGPDRRVAVVATTERADGDVNPERVPADELRRRQVQLTGRPWVMLDEVHGTDVHVIDGAADPRALLAGRGDVLVADRGDDVLAVWVGDCAPIALLGANGSTRVLAHAGWRGLAGGVVDVAVDAVEAALDVPSAVRAALRRRGIELDVAGACTGCDERFHSHRRRAETGRHALLSWLEVAP
jgi:copper oxidase (laccase) domain-containing protein